MELDKEGFLFVDGWEMDCYALVETWGHCPFAGYLFCGYSYDELREIQSRPSEFIETPFGT